MEIKKTIEKNGGNKISYKNLRKKHEKITIKDLELIRNYGYFFPEKADFDENIIESKTEDIEASNELEVEIYTVEECNGMVRHFARTQKKQNAGI